MGKKVPYTITKRRGNPTFNATYDHDKK